MQVVERPAISYAVTQGSLPGGLTLNPTSGIITGYPTSTGTSSFTVQATDSVGDPPASQALSITVDPEVPFSITSTSLPSASQNGYYQQVLGATGGTLPYSWAITAGALPAGLNSVRPAYSAVTHRIRHLHLYREGHRRL